MATKFDTGKFTQDVATAGASSLLGSLFGIANSALQNRYNKKLMREQNQFNADEAAKQRDWQEYMYNQYSSPSAMVEQYKAAGLNPALSGNTTGQTFSGSSAQASQSIPSADPGLTSLVPLFIEMLDLKDKFKNTQSQRDLQKEQAETEDSKQRNLDADTEGKKIENQFKPDILKQNLEQGKLNIENSTIGINLALEDLKQKPLEYAQRISNLSNDSVNRKFTIAATNKTLEETATERLKQAGLVIDNRNKYLMSTSIILEQCLTAADITLKDAKTAKTHNESESVRLDNLKQSYEINVKKRFGYVSNEFLDTFGITTVMHWVINAYDAARSSFDSDYTSVYEIPK